MAAPLNTCTTIEQRGVVPFLWTKNVDATKDIHKEMLPALLSLPLRHPRHDRDGTCFLSPIKLFIFVSVNFETQWIVSTIRP
jgi:hypothetical protein